MTTEMSGSLTRIQQELKDLGHQPGLLDTPEGQIVAFLYRVETGPYRSCKYMLGFSVDGSEPYPQYPPHWLHISPPVDDGLGGVRTEYKNNGRTWVKMSRVFSGWDASDKNMKAYMNDHVRSVWHYMKLDT